RNWSYTLINVLGLGLAMACCIVAFLINAVNFNFDRDYEDIDQLYQVHARRVVGQDQQIWGITPLPLSGAIASEFPEVELSDRIGGSSHLFVYEGQTFDQYVHYVDSSLLKMLNYELIEGSYQDFNQPGALFIDHRLAEKLFGEEAAVGKQINVSFGEGEVHSMMVKGVFSALSKNSTVYFTAISNLDYLVRVREYDQTQWESPFQVTTLVKLTENNRAEAMNSQLEKFAHLYNEVRPNRKVENYYLEPFANLKASNREIYGTYTQQSLPMSMLVGTAVCGIMILLMACFNFTNTSIAISGRRMKEIGIRKTLGGLKGQLIRQFFLENFVLSLLALGAALLFAEILTPAYNSLWPLDLETNYQDNPQLIVFILGMLFFTTLLAGSYPAWYISRFEPSAILKGSTKLKGGNAFTRVLLTLQFGIAVMALVVGVVFSQNARWQATLDLGYDRDQVVVSVVNNTEEYEEMTRKLKENPEVEQVSAGANHIGLSGRLEKIFYAGNEYQGRNFSVGDNYLKTMGLELIDGRDFLEGSENDRQVSVIVNEMLVQTLNLENPVGTRIRIEEEFFEIIGVVKNFMPYGLFDPIRPTAIKLAEKSDYRFVSARTSSDKLVSVFGFMESTWKENFPGKPFEGYYQDEAVADSKRTNDNIRDVFWFLSILTLLLSSTGLFAIVSLNILRRMREISIRKVLGASIAHIIGLINREYLVIFSIAGLLGVGAGYFSAEALLSSIFEYHNGVSLTAFLMAIGALLSVCVVTVGSKVYRAANANPTDVLRSE
ncbi:MAG: ABC transporter permease, partial [Bacteroidetes bacterium]|nr:ABC transporter permease [Bacteroidota bacterium]